MKRFRYALEPVLLTRKWDLDKLMQALSEQNAAIAKQRLLEEVAESKVSHANGEWNATLAEGRNQSVDQFRVSTQYMGDLARQVREHAAKTAEMVALRDELIQRVITARRSVDAAEQHRDEMKAHFVQQRLSGEFKIADDQWNTLQSGVQNNGS